jgi:hypothetical protein
MREKQSQIEVKAEASASIPSSGLLKTPEFECCFHDEELSPLEADMERDAMIETIRELERERDALHRGCGLALQHIQFVAGERKRGWDLRYVREVIESALALSSACPRCGGSPLLEGFHCSSCGNTGKPDTASAPRGASPQPDVAKVPSLSQPKAAFEHAPEESLRAPFEREIE